MMCNACLFGVGLCVQNCREKEMEFFSSSKEWAQYEDYLKCFQPVADVENGPSPDDVPTEGPMTFGEFLEYLKEQEQSAADAGPHGYIQ